MRKRNTKRIVVVVVCVVTLAGVAGVWAWYDHRQEVDQANKEYMARLEQDIKRSAEQAIKELEQAKAFREDFPILIEPVFPDGLHRQRMLYGDWREARFDGDFVPYSELSLREKTVQNKWERFVRQQTGGEDE